MCKAKPAIKGSTTPRALRNARWVESFVESKSVRICQNACAAPERASEEEPELAFSPCEEDSFDTWFETEGMAKGNCIMPTSLRRLGIDARNELRSVRRHLDH